jgi:hypothetical protein
MDKPKRVRRVTVETERTFIFRIRNSVRFQWCAECESEVGMVSEGGAAREAGVSEFAIYKLVEERALHFSEDTELGILVCLNSLRELMPGTDNEITKGQSRNDDIN